MVMRARIPLAAAGTGLLSALVAGGGALGAATSGPTCPQVLPVTALRGNQHVERAGAPLVPGATLRAGDRVVVGRGAALLTSLGGAGFRFSRSAFTVECRAAAGADPAPPGADPAAPGLLVLVLDRGRVSVTAGSADPRTAVLETADASNHALRTRTRYTVERDFHGRRTLTAVVRGRVAVSSARDPELQSQGRPGRPPIKTPRGGAPRPETYPFAVSPLMRRVPRGAVPRFWADGRVCSVGCRPGGAVSGWPLRPFKRQHALRAGLNELRDANFHLGIDIQARDFQRVYAMQPGSAHIVKASGPDERVQVGRYIYWHVYTRVREGQGVHVHQLVGKVKRGFGHLHLSEVDSANRYINPLRPGGRVLRPWADNAPPVIGEPRFNRGGRVVVQAFDPQSFETRTTYWTPVLAPAALAYRLATRSGRRIGSLHFALRGSQNLPNGLRHRVYAAGARRPGFTCFRRKEVCVPTWRYKLAGGLAPPVNRGALGPGSYRLIVYAWDWAGNVSARDAEFTVRRSDLRRGGSVTAPWRPARPAPPPRARPTDRG